MKQAIQSDELVLRLWTLLHRVRDELAVCEDSVFGEYGITMEQFSLLASVKALGGSARPSELAEILERTPNSVSMLVDRMVKAGLVKRTRDRQDRRVVHVALTSKGENALKPAEPAGWELIQKILSSLSYEEKHALVSLLEKVKSECFGYLHPGLDRAEVTKRSAARQLDFYERVAKNRLSCSPEDKRQVAKRRKSPSQN